MADVVCMASEALQTIQDRCGREDVPESRVKFPRTFIRKVQEIREELPHEYIRNEANEALVRNICYSLMMVDILQWLLTRTDLYGAAASMTRKEIICLYGAICESLLKAAVKNKKISFKKRSDKLVEEGVINADLKSRIDWIWDTRTNEHLSEVEGLEYDKYEEKDVARAKETYIEFCSKLEPLFKI